MEAFQLLLHGFAVLMMEDLALMMVGLVLGIFVGVLPGLGSPNGVAILLPLTFTMDPTSAIVMLSPIGGAVRQRPPRSVQHSGRGVGVATTFDSYPMATAGQAAEARPRHSPRRSSDRWWRC